MSMIKHKDNIFYIETYNENKILRLQRLLVTKSKFQPQLVEIHTSITFETELLIVQTPTSITFEINRVVGNCKSKILHKLLLRS